MKITGSIRRATVAGQADRYKRFAEQCRELAKPLNGRLKQTLEEMADVWDGLARAEDRRVIATVSGEHIDALNERGEAS
jgi:hypothetical protein